MPLKDTLFNDLKDAMKNKETIRKNTIQLVRAGILQIEKDENISLDDEGVLEVIIKEVKKRRDVLPDFQKSGRSDLINDLNLELEVLLGYLPRQLDDFEIDAIIDEAIIEIGAQSIKDMGKIMKQIQPKTKGRVDNKLVSEKIKQKLGCI